MLRPTLLALAASLLSAAHAACSIPRTAEVAVYSDTAGGVGPNSAVWSKAFFDWLASANPELEVAYITDATEIAFPGGCDLSSLPALKLWVQPGGDAYEQSLALGMGGRDNLVAFAALPGRSVMATCAGWYYSAGQYWWFGDWYPHYTTPLWYPTGA